MGEREDLGAMLFRVLGVIGEREAPILEAHGVTMWEYVIMSALGEDAAVSQNELAVLSRRDPTRLIGNLDALERRDLVSREVDPTDRRRRSVRLTKKGRATLLAARAAIAAMEDDLLEILPAAERTAFRAGAAKLAEPKAGA